MNSISISDEYRAEQRRMHDVHEHYGVECLRYGKILANLIDSRMLDTMLDYGSGKGRILEALAPHVKRDVAIALYDPGVPEFDRVPEPAQLVTCIDVLEHVEPECTEVVIDHIAELTEKLCFITIGLTPAAKTLSDGRNAHINLRPTRDWLILLMERFRMMSAVDDGRSLVFMGKK